MTRVVLAIGTSHLCGLVRLLLLASFVLLATSCVATDQLDSPAVFYKRADGLMPSFEVTVSRDRSVLYVGLKDAKTMGKRQFKISETQYQRLLRAFDELNYAAMRPTYFSPVLDGPPSLEIVLSTKESSKKLLAHRYGFVAWPRNLHLLVWAIEDTLGLPNFLCPSEALTAEGRVIDRCQATRDSEQDAFKRSK